MKLDGVKIISPHAVFEAVTDATKTKAVLFGDSEEQLAEVLSYIQAVEMAKPEELRKLTNSNLETRTYLVGCHVTIADIVVASKLLPLFVRCSNWVATHELQGEDQI